MRKLLNNSGRVSMSQDTFRKEFELLRELGEQTFVLRGSTIIVEILPTPEIKTKGGLIIETPSDHIKGGSAAAHKVEVARVLMCGQGYYKESGGQYDEEGKHFSEEFEELEVKPGAVILLPKYSAQFLSHI